MEVVIVIVTYNGMKWIEQCLSSIPINYKIVVLDNNSTDGTISFIKNNFPSIHLIEQSQNLGFGAANNIGISYALNQGTEYVFLLNQDAYIEDNTVSILIQTHKNNCDYGVLSPIHLNGKGNQLDANFAVYIQKNRELQFDSLKGSLQKRPYELPFINAAAWLVPKTTFEIIGGFDPIFYHYGEDNNFCQRALFHNLKIGVVPNSYIKHDREMRKSSNITTLAERLKAKERIYKYKWANINSNYVTSMKRQKKGILKKVLKNSILLNYRKVYELYLEYKLINRIKVPIELSRFKNKKRGKHYLPSSL